MAAILIIEDDDFFQSFLDMVLSGGGHQVTLCGDGETGIESARKQMPDLVLCDLSMPGMSGFDVLRALSDLDHLSSVPKIALSGHDKPEDRQAAFAAGADAYVTKPVDVADLHERIQQAIAGELPPPGD